MDHTTTTNFPIWKLESTDPEEANQGEFCLRYMLSVISNQTLYLGRCDCDAARALNTPIVSFKPEVACFFCGENVELQPVPRIAEGRWVYEPTPEEKEYDELY